MVASNIGGISLITIWNRGARHVVTVVERGPGADRGSLSTNDSMPLEPK